MPQVQNPYRTGWPRRDRLAGMTGYGQFCSIARAHEVLGGRWTLLIVREILCGSRRFTTSAGAFPQCPAPYFPNDSKLSSLLGRSLGSTVPTALNTTSLKGGRS
jgi:hypothetical protein